MRKRHIFINGFAVVALLLSSSAEAASQAAIGFIENTTNGSTRLAFVRTQDGWQPSCYFVKQGPGQLSMADINNPCADALLAAPWKVLKADGKTVDIGSLKGIDKGYYADIGLVAADASRTSSMATYKSAPSRETWEGEKDPPLIVFTGGITLNGTFPKTDGIAPLTDAVRQKISAEYLKKDRIIAICDLNTGREIKTWKATAKDVMAGAAEGLSGTGSFYSAELKIPDNANCDEEDTQRELFFDDGSQISDLTTNFPRDSGVFNTRLRLFGAFRVDDDNSSQIILVAYVQGYDLDGYALFDASGKLLARSTWIYQ